MSSIGVIVRAGGNVDTLPQDWVPAPLGPRQEVAAIIQRSAPGVDCERRVSLQHLDLNIELQLDEGPMPRSITVSGVWGAREMSFLRELCNRLNARLYDSEASEFIEA